MSNSHRIEYAKSGQAKCTYCHEKIGNSELRYGAPYKADFGEGVRWRHWGCVTPQILSALGKVNLQVVPGFRYIRDDDKARVRNSVTRKSHEPAVVTTTSGTQSAGASRSSSQKSSPRKRKAEVELATPPSSQPSTLAPSNSHRSLGPSSSVIEITEDQADLYVWDNDDAPDELYCSLSTSVVGVQYYQGLVGPFEQVRLIREPTNKYDRNAIQVKNISNQQIGHLPRKVAEKLAPLMDQNLVTPEGHVINGNDSSGVIYSISMVLKIYAPSNKRDQMEPLLVWATPRQAGFPPRPVTTGSSSNGPSYGVASATPIPAAPASVSGLTPAQQEKYARQLEAHRRQQEALSKAAELSQMLNTLEKVNDGERRESLLDSLCSKDDILNLPEHLEPPGIKSEELTVDLLKHQRQALRWCIDREYPVLPSKESDEPVQFWQFKGGPPDNHYFNIATKSPQLQPPVLGRGALCADAMGLGKTLTMLALILATKNDVSKEFAKSTLIVVPLSIISNWEKQIADHVVPGTLSYIVYHGSKRSVSSDDLKRFDIVITTYQTVVGEAPGPVAEEESGPAKKKKKTSSSLFEVPWKRIILDEGHTIRNQKTKMAKAMFALEAERRWVLSGTPIINSPKDLGSILTFLRICRPLDNEDFFKRLLLRPLKDGDPVGGELLRALMSQVCIRRTKEMQDSKGNHLIPLPPVDMTVVPVALTDDAREFYDAVEEVIQQRVERSLARGDRRMQTHILGLLTRLRQIALHPGLLPANYLQQLLAADDNGEERPRIQITPEHRVRLQGLLARAIEDCEECAICLGLLENPRITSCAHTFCFACIAEVISRDPKCPMDRRRIGMSELIEPLPPTEMTQVRVRREEELEEASGFRAGSSAKIDQLVHLLKLTPSNEKSLVFSQFTSFLDKIGETLHKEGIPHVRFDGQMSAKRRQDVLNKFSVPISDSGTKNTASKPVKSGRSVRQRPKSAQSVIADDLSDAGAADDDDDDFAGSDTEVSDDEFINSDDDLVSPKKNKGKSKAKGKGKAKANSQAARSKRQDSFYDDDLDLGLADEKDKKNPRVMLISLKAGALGLNLTVANNVYLMDPWWQEGIESQAIDRCNRIGQTKPVHVYQLVAENTVESKVIDIQNKKKSIVQQAFSGIKSKESQRQKKEARLQGQFFLIPPGKRQIEIE